MNTRLFAIIRKEFIHILRDPAHAGDHVSHSDHPTDLAGLCGDERRAAFDYCRFRRRQDDAKPAVDRGVSRVRLFFDQLSM